MSVRQQLGKSSEDRAANYLISRGYTIVTRRWKARHGELDLVALKHEVLVFIEVKARERGHDDALASITRLKWKHWQTAVAEYLASTEQHHRECRYDIITVKGDDIEHYEAVEPLA